MSTGFRLFLLMVLAFAAVWICQFSSQDLMSWLDAPDRIRALNSPAEIAKSPVEQADGIQRYDMQYRGPELLSEPDKPPEKKRQNPRSRGGLGNSVYADPGPDYAPDFGESEEWSSGETADHDDRTYGPDDDDNGDPAEFDEGDDSEAGDEYTGGENPDEQESNASKEALRVYTVVSGDNLCKIAKKLLGKETRHKEIMKLNKDILKGGTTILPGMTLLIPPAD